MFKMKYTISLLDSKWNPIKTNLKLQNIPRIGEFLFLDQYYEVLHVIHTLDGKHNIFIVIQQLVVQPNKI